MLFGILERPSAVCGSSWLTPLLVHLGNAKILNSSSGDDMQTRVNMTEHEFTIALMVFLVAYSVFEAPSNIALKVLSPHRFVPYTEIPYRLIIREPGG